MKNTEFKKGDKVNFMNEAYTFINYYNYQNKNDFAIIFNGKNREYQPIEFLTKI